MILTNFKPQKITILAIFIRKIVQNSQKSSKFEENSKINNYSLVPQIDHHIALCLYDLTCVLASTVVGIAANSWSEQSTVIFESLHIH